MTGPKLVSTMFTFTPNKFAWGTLPRFVPVCQPSGSLLSGHQSQEFLVKFHEVRSAVWPLLEGHDKTLRKILLILLAARGCRHRNGRDRIHVPCKRDAILEQLAEPVVADYCRDRRTDTHPAFRADLLLPRHRPLARYLTSQEHPKLFLGTQLIQKVVSHQGRCLRGMDPIKSVVRNRRLRLASFHDLSHGGQNP